MILISINNDIVLFIYLINKNKFYAIGTTE